MNMTHLSHTIQHHHSERVIGYSYLRHEMERRDLFERKRWTHILALVYSAADISATFE